MRKCNNIEDVCTGVPIDLHSIISVDFDKWDFLIFRCLDTKLSLQVLWKHICQTRIIIWLTTEMDPLPFLWSHCIWQANCKKIFQKLDQARTSLISGWNTVSFIIKGLWYDTLNFPFLEIYFILTKSNLSMILTIWRNVFICQKIKRF